MIGVRSVAGAVAVLCLAVITPAQAQMTPEQRREEVGKIPWVRNGSHKLGESSSTISIPPDHVAAFAADAVRFESLVGNGGLAAKHVEAVVVNRRNEQVIFQSFNDEGYVTLDDWKDVDAAAMLATIKENTEKGNAERARNGFAQVRVKDWLQQPTLDRDSNTVRWAIVADDGSTPIVNAVALRLGRRGFEKLTWVGDAGAYAAVGGELDLMLRSHAFDPGSRYADYVTGDKVAAYGVGALVATMVGAKLAKVGLFAGLLVLLKKFGVFAVVALGGVLAKFRRALFGQKQPAAAE
ncbi:MAG TPA: DUF2167 domain-containing protein [Stellaceae bacterium]|nr:DUF2167 domain-containing protein [Stellaceae bacterium]